MRAAGRDRRNSVEWAKDIVLIERATKPLLG